MKTFLLPVLAPSWAQLPKEVELLDGEISLALFVPSASLQVDTCGYWVLDQLAPPSLQSLVLKQIDAEQWKKTPDMKLQGLLEHVCAWPVHTYKHTPKDFVFQPKESADLETREEVICYANPESMGGVEEMRPSRKKMRYRHCAERDSELTQQE